MKILKFQEFPHRAPIGPLWAHRGAPHSYPAPLGYVVCVPVGVCAPVQGLHAMWSSCIENWEILLLG